MKHLTLPISQTKKSTHAKWFALRSFISAKNSLISTSVVSLFVLFLGIALDNIQMYRTGAILLVAPAVIATIYAYHILKKGLDDEFEG